MPEPQSPKRESMLARPLDEQRIPPADVVQDPAEAFAAAPDVRRRVVGLLAIERDQWYQYHVWYRDVADERLKLRCAEIGRTESQHSLALTSLIPPAELPLVRALVFEQAALETFAQLSQEEPDANLRAGFEYVVPESAEHAFRLSQQLAVIGVDPEMVTAGRISLRPGRPLEDQNLASFDCIKRPYDKRTVDPMTRARLQLATALVRALHDDYRSLVAQTPDPATRRLFAAIRAVKEFHLDFFESFLDPAENLLERAVAREFAEAEYYRRSLDQEADESLCRLLRRHLADEIGHLNLWEEELRRLGGDPWHLTQSNQLPKAAISSPAAIIDALVGNQLQRRSKGKSYVEIGKTIEAFS